MREMGIELVDLSFSRVAGRHILKVTVDKAGGVNLGTCVQVSERLGRVLDEKDLINVSYNLEVSSPGIERPLKKASDFKRFKGSKISLKTKIAIDGQKNFIGIIKRADERGIILLVDNREIEIVYEDITTAHLVPNLQFK